MQITGNGKSAPGCASASAASQPATMANAPWPRCDQAFALAAQYRLEPQQHEGHAGRKTQYGRDQHRPRDVLALQHVPAMHEMMRAAACRHQRETDAEARPAAIPMQADGFERGQRAEAGVSEPDREIAEADDPIHHDDTVVLVPIGAPMCSRNSSMK
jgi:hypothetical protein